MVRVFLHLLMAYWAVTNRMASRFSSPSQFSMYIAANFLENQAYVKSFLHTSHERLWAARILTEKILDENNIQYHRKG